MVMAITTGLLPNLASTPPHGGMLGTVLVHKIPMQFSLAAIRPDAPGRIQWFVLESATHPNTCSLANAMARCIQVWAFKLPGPLRPSQRSQTPRFWIQTDSALISMVPDSTLGCKRRPSLPAHTAWPKALPVRSIGRTLLAPAKTHCTWYRMKYALFRLPFSYIIDRNYPFTAPIITPFTK